MSNRVEIKDYTNNKLVIKELMRGELVGVKTGETLKKGQLVTVDKTNDKNLFTAVKKEVSGSETCDLECTKVYRVYLGEDITAKENEKILIGKRVVLNKDLFLQANDLTKKGEHGENKEELNEFFRLILENNGIYLEEVR